MRLNLGCGRAQLPTTADNPYTQHLQMLPDTAYDLDERWVNVDRVGIDGVNEVVDLFEYPWVRSSNGNPWNDSTVDEIWCSHIVEHIPHTARFNAGATATHRAQGGLDGWYAFFFEAWRILKPGGLMHITAPLAFSLAGTSDPTHTRYITPTSFGYLVPNIDAPFDYQIAARFEATDNPLLRPDGEWQQKVESGEIAMERVMELGTHYLNVFDEVYVCLKAVKTNENRGANP